MPKTLLILPFIIAHYSILAMLSKKLIDITIIIIFCCTEARVIFFKGMLLLI